MARRRPFETKSCFSECKGTRLSQISLSSKDSGVKEMFYRRMLLNLKHYQVPFLPLCLFFLRASADAISLTLRHHSALSGTCFRTFLSCFPSPCLLSCGIFCSLPSTLCLWVCFSFTSHMPNFQGPSLLLHLECSFHMAPGLVCLHFTEVRSPSSLTYTPSTSCWLAQGAASAEVWRVSMQWSQGIFHPPLA